MHRHPAYTGYRSTQLTQRLVTWLLRSLGGASAGPMPAMALAPEDQIEVPPEVVSSIKSLDTQVAQLTQTLRLNAASGARDRRHGRVSTTK